MFRFLKKLFGMSDQEEGPDTTQMDQTQEMAILEEEILSEQTSRSVLREDFRRGSGRETQLTLSSKDLMHMARKLTVQGEYLRAEQLIRDGVKGAVDNPEIWWLLLEIEEPLNRKGRAYYCVEQIIEIDPENEVALEKKEELQPYIDEQLNYFIEYKMAPEFYRLK